MEKLISEYKEMSASQQYLKEFKYESISLKSERMLGVL